jgi:hypothetical protein
MEPSIWTPDESTSSGIYHVKVSSEGKSITKRTVYIR